MARKVQKARGGRKKDDKMLPCGHSVPFKPKRNKRRSYKNDSLERGSRMCSVEKMKFIDNVALRAKASGEHSEKEQALLTGIKTVVK
jgi:hypothetical protein